MYPDGNTMIKRESFESLGPPQPVPVKMVHTGFGGPQRIGAVMQQVQQQRNNKGRKVVWHGMACMVCTSDGKYMIHVLSCSHIP